MIAVITILCAFPLGYFLRTHLAANTAYAIAYLWAFNFQTVYLLPMFLEDGADDVAEDFPFAYGLFTLAIFLGGFGLVWLGRRTALRRRAALPA